MLKYPRLLAELTNHQWAITHDAMRSIVSVLEQDVSVDLRPTMHGLSQSEAEEVSASMGDLEAGTKLSRVQGRVGTLFINGPIIPRSNAMSAASGLTSISALEAEFRAFEEDSSVDQIVLVLDSPGGAVTGISEFAAMVAACNKHVTAYVYGMAASAAYWIASAADTIVSAPTGLSGALGVIMELSAPEEDGKIVITSAQTPKKRLNPASKEGRAEYEKLVTSMAEVFLATVAENRRIPLGKVLSDFGEGAVLSAANALEVGMIDKIDTLANTLKLASKKQDQMLTMATGPQLKEQSMPTLQQLIAEHPLLSEEIKAIEKAAREDGAVAATKELKNAMSGAVPYLTNAEYPEMVREMAAKVISGESDLSKLEGAVAVCDMMAAKKEEVKAVQDSDAQPAAAASVVNKLSNDGKLRTTEDIDAEIRAMRGEVL